MIAKSITDPDNPRGSALVVILLIMTAMSILGVMSIHTSAVELAIARYERESREIFFLSESIAFEGVQRLVNTPAVDLEDKVQFWHHGLDSMKSGHLNFRDPLKWDVDGHGEDNAMCSALDSSAYFAAVEGRLATGSSAIVTESRLYMNQVYGLSTKYDTAAIVEIGYYLRY